MKRHSIFRRVLHSLALICFWAVAHDSCLAQTPPTPVPFTINFLYPTNGQVFTGPTNIAIYSRTTDSNVVHTVQYFSGTARLGTVTNTNGVMPTNSTASYPFPMLWSNVPPGSYTLTAIATDVAGATATSAPVNITVKAPTPPPPVPFTISFWYPTNGQVFTGPTNIGIHALVTDSNVVHTVQYFAGTVNLGTVTNTNGVLLTNSTASNPFFLLWSNVPPGSYLLTAIATDVAGATATSAPVSITVKAPPPPPPVPFLISFWYPTNGQVFTGPTNIGVHARVTDSNVVHTVQYFSGTASIGIVTNTSGVILTNSTASNPFEMLWSNVPPASYTLTAVATDVAGVTATSAPVNITVKAPPPVPFVVSFWYPTNGQVFTGPTNIGIHALVTDSNLVHTVQYFSGTASLGTVTNTNGVLLTNSTASNPFFLLWSNVPPGSYTLTAIATDVAGATATSAPVNITVISNLPPTNPPPIVTIYSPDPVAIEGSNSASASFSPPTGTNYYGGTNTATFLVRRDSATNTTLTVYYSIGGTASNGVDYVAIPNAITLAVGQRYGVITIVPLEDADVTNHYETVILALTLPPHTTNTSSAAYKIGSPAKAGAVILEETILPISRPLIHSVADSLHVSLPATNGMNFCLQVSTNFVDWVSICTNTVLKGSAQFVDPASTGGPGILYRIVPVAAPPLY